MSLINQVLQDLEKRHASEPELKSLPPHVRAVQGQAPRVSAGTLAIAAAVIAVLAVACVLYFGGWLKRADRVVAVAPVTVAAPPIPQPEPSPPASVVAPPVETFVPASRLSEELSFVPAPGKRKEAPLRVAPPVPKTQAVTTIPPEFRAAVDPPAPKAADPAPAPLPSPPEPATSTAAAVPASPPAPEPRGAIDKQVREMTPQQRAEVAFRKGAAQLQEARASAAEASFREALREDVNHVGARQALLGLLLDAKRNDEAEQHLKEALALNPRQPRHAMVLARLQVDRGEVPGAVNTLVAALPYVQSDAEYYAFLAALLQREGRHRETVDYYRAALRISPGNGLWLMGQGISLRATSQFGEAREAFQRALDTRQLGGDLKTFTEKQLRELAAPK